MVRWAGETVGAGKGRGSDAPVTELCVSRNSDIWNISTCRNVLRLVLSGDRTIMNWGGGGYCR